jgi:hypothetical protein
MKKIIGTNLEPIGYSQLIKRFTLKVVPHYRSTYIAPTGAGSHHSEAHEEIIILPNAYGLSEPDNPLLQLEFAIKHEGINLEIIACCFSHITPAAIVDFVKDTPSGKYRRIIWFLYEFLTDTRLALDDLKQTPYVNVLDPEKYYVASALKSKRHAVNNNLLGNKLFCPIVRKTSVLTEFELKDLSHATQTLVNSIDPVILARAVNYLYTKETISSFGIEKIKPDLKRTEKFITLLEEVSQIEGLEKELLLSLQNAIVDPEYQDKDYRHTPNYVGELTMFYTQKIHYISPKPEDLPTLMTNFLACESRLIASDVYPVVIAAILSFGFVFLHPFEDGNGRIHRFIIHYILSKTKFTPDTIIFPVSAVMLKNIRQYDAVLERFSKPLLQAINHYELNDLGELSVFEETKIHYQYIDFTLYVEYLFACIETTLQDDFQEELTFIANYDRTKIAIQAIIDMPDLKIDRIIRCIAQNNGTLGRKMRSTYFNELSDEKILAIEQVVQNEMLPH